MPTTPDNTATTWRDLADQLTPEQIARFEHFERLLGATDVHVVGLLKDARWEAEQNLTDQHVFGHIPLPQGARSADHWEDDGTGRWTRRLSASSRSVDGTGTDATVYVDGVQSSDGAVAWSLYVLVDDRKPLSGEQARRFAAMIVAAADELDWLR
jgi:hypothetical protein